MSRERPQVQATAPADPPAAREFEALLGYLKQSRGFDFGAYKPSSLMRRVQVRMQASGITGFAAYQDFLQVDPSEFTRLFNTILINVTSFFRDPPAWDYLAEQVLPGLLDRPSSSAPVRVWSAGCASGEEAYSIAMLLAEALGFDRFRERVKIYATDVDEEALNQARQAVYTDRSMEDVSPELRRKYFERVDDRYAFNKDLRRSVIFGRHDLIQDAPISRVNLLICRNCLMYFHSEAQQRILSRFHFALTGNGVLFLGKAESLLTHIATFRPIDVKRRIFGKIEPAGGPERDRALELVRRVDDGDHRPLRDAAADAAPVAQAVVDDGGAVVALNQQIRTLFGLSTRDLGRPLQDLELSYRPFELRSCIEQATTERRPVRVTDGRWAPAGGSALTLDLLVVPVADHEGGTLGCALYFIDTTRQRRLQDELQRANEELETALEELQSTNEELETTNEELQSTVEELETTNEELQSTNEELETMNEELQSTNAELQTTNEEARERGDELAGLNEFLEGILTSLRAAVVVLDRELRVHKWNPTAQDMWGLRADEVQGQHFLNLDIGLPVEQLRAPIRACLAHDAESLEVELAATNRRGRPVRVTVTCSTLRGSMGTVGASGGVIMVMEEMDATGGA
jgi:two-component system CheB/CheR fusion protein